MTQNFTDQNLSGVAGLTQPWEPDDRFPPTQNDTQIGAIIFGSGQDGDAVLDGTATFAAFAGLVGSTYTLTRDVFLANLTVNAGITLQSGGFKIFVSNTLLNRGTIAADGKNAALGVAGAGSAIGTTGIGAAGGAGHAGVAVGSNGSSVQNVNTLSDASAAGGAGGAGGAQAGGLAGTYPTSNTNGGANYLVPMLSGMLFTQQTGGISASINIIQGGAGGGGGGSDNAGVTGGGGGGGGGVLVLHAFWFLNNGTIRAAGGNGAAASGAGGNGGGGGGGGGGIILSIARFRETGPAGVVTVPGGAGGAGFGTGIAGSKGSDGHVNLFAA